jgi:1,4-dihydroxy-2-naphthoyl-CoA synthase
MLIKPTLVRLLLVAAAVTAAAAAGCAHKKPPSKPSPQPATPQQVQEIRNAYFRAYPDSRVGVVIATLKHPNGYFVAVGDVNGSDFRDGETVTFVDAHQRVLTTGTVVRVMPDSVHVAVDRPPAGGRQPGVGDVMVKLPFGATTL